MISNVKAFKNLESILAKDGTIARFEEENGKVLGRMMIALDVKTMEVKGGLWSTPQAEHYDEPAREWIEYFIETLVKGIDNGSFGVPMYAFVNDTSSFEVYPSDPE